MHCHIAFISLVLAMVVSLGRSLLSKSMFPMRGVGKGALSLTQRSLTVNILVVGKKELRRALDRIGLWEFEKRLKPVMKLNTQFLKSDEALSASVKVAKNVVALDENGSSTLLESSRTCVQKAGGGRRDPNLCYRRLCWTPSRRQG